MKQEQIRKAYDFLPPTTCDRRGNCCSIFVRMTYTEFGNMKAYIEEHWSSEEQEALRELVVMQQALRVASPKELSAKDAYRLKPHCLMFDEEKFSCRVYEARPLPCRSFGFAGECSLVKLQSNPDVPAERVRTREQLGKIEEAVMAANEEYVHPHSGRTIPAEQRKPIEFWFALDVLGWDPTMDPEDPAFLGRRFDSPTQS